MTLVSLKSCKPKAKDSFFQIGPLQLESHYHIFWKIFILWAIT